MTLSTPLKVLGLAALALALAGAGVVTLLLGHTKHGTTPAPAVTPTTVHRAAPSPAKPVAPPKPAIHLVAGLPAPLHAALLRSKEVVAFVYVPTSPDDRTLLAQVKKGAHDARVGFVALNAHDEKVAEAVFSWARSSAVPATYVVRRPGNAVFELQGLTDRIAVAQAAASAR
ncbi:MAG TPA: hypothetical protein VHC67_02650 [Gaiellaceae bacterium]|nr:hypothetical protein [Gaiellaceae bacterium]